MAGIKGVVFDKDGTLFDFNATWGAWAAGFLKSLAREDRALEAEMAEALRFDLERRIFHPDSFVIAGTPGEIAAALLPLLDGWNASGLVDEMNRSAASAPLVEAVPLKPLLDVLRGHGYVLGVVTNDAEAPARAHLETAGIAADFDFIAGFDSGYGCKPEPGQLLGFAEHVGLPVPEILMVGDSTHDLLAGRAAGMKTLGVLTGPAEEAELAPHADAILENIGGLPAWLGH